jgi:hypothetical protein
MSDSMDENTLLEMSFTTIDSMGDVSYRIYHNNMLVSENNTYNIFMTYLDSGIHNFTFYAIDTNSNVSITQQIEVLDVLMSSNLITPISALYTTHNIEINAFVSTYADTCFYNLSRLNGANSYFVSSGFLAGNNQSFYENLSLTQDGNYSIFILCSNEYDSTNITRTFNVDTTNPVIISKSYSIDENGDVTFNIVTNILCSCKYDLQDRSYDLMSSSFSYTSSVVHSTRIGNLANGDYTYYIKCKSINGIVSNTELLSFNIVTKPFASIVLSKSSPLKAGIYKVELETTKSVIVAPLLTYNFNTDTALKYVTLTGSDTNWEGYLIIDENTPDRIGTFHYSATDYSGNMGNIITSGELFLVDTTKPSAPTSISITSQSNGNIKLKWYYDDESINKYNIYRSLEGDPDYVDYYDTSSSTSYIDSDVIDGLNYYYRIAAVDDADNDGLLSGVVEQTSTRIDYVDNSDFNDINNNIQQIIDPVNIQKINQLILEFNNYLLSIDATKSELNKINDPNKLKIISILSLSENMNSARSNIESLILEANALKNQNLRSADLDIKLNKLKMDALKAKSLVVEDIIISEQSSYDQITQESDVSLAIDELLSINLSKSVFNAYSNANKQLQDNIVVSTDIFIFKLRYFGKDDYDKYTLVKKIVSSSEELENVSIVEVIPKSFERKASDIVFDISNQKKPVIVKDDPVLKWDTDLFNKQTIYYMINNNAEMHAAKATKTLVLYTPNFKVTDTMLESDSSSDNKLTGFISNNFDYVNFSSLSMIQWIILIGVGLILGLSTYYVSLDRIEKKRNDSRLKDHKIMSGKIDNSFNSGFSSTNYNTSVKSINRASNSINTSNNSLNLSNNSIADSVNSSKIIDTKKHIKSKSYRLLSNFFIKKLLRKKSLNLSNIPLTQINVPLPKVAGTDANIIDVSTLNNDLMKNNDIKYFDIHLKLTQANVRINNFDYENARIIYNLCLNKYSAGEYSISEKKELGIMLDYLYSKLVVYRTIFISRKHINLRDYTSLKQDILVINSISTKLYSLLKLIDDDYKDAELKFINYVNNSKKHLESILS